MQVNHNVLVQLYSKCPPFALTHTQRRVHHCVTVVSITRWSSLPRANTYALTQLDNVFDSMSVTYEQLSGIIRMIRCKKKSRRNNV